MREGQQAVTALRTLRSVNGVADPLPVDLPDWTVKAPIFFLDVAAIGVERRDVLGDYSPFVQGA